MSQAKAQVLTEKWDTHPGKNLEGLLSFTTPNGHVAIGGINRVPATTDTELDSVEVWVGGPAEGAPTWRIINPPTLVADPLGDINVVETLPGGKTLVRKYREDPIQALAEFLATNNGESEQG